MEDNAFVKLRYSFAKKLDELMLGSNLIEDLDRVYMPLANMINVGITSPGQTIIIGVNGAQGAGKTSFGHLMKLVLEEGFNLKTLNLSIDDLYLSHEAREVLAERVHPLLKTRGVPGTHDVQLGLDLLDKLCNASGSQKTLIPRFDKATDNPFSDSECDSFIGRPDVILFDGWFMGAEKQPDSDLYEPINKLEEEEDPDGVWRRYVNDMLGKSYKQLFDKLDLLVMLQVPSFEKVYEWRTLQEHKLRLSSSGKKNLRVMTDEEVKRFIMHYERITRWELTDLPAKCDMLFKVNDNHRIYI